MDSKGFLLVVALIGLLGFMMWYSSHQSVQKEAAPTAVAAVRGGNDSLAATAAPLSNTNAEAMRNDIAMARKAAQVQQASNQQTTKALQGPAASADKLDQ